MSSGKSMATVITFSPLGYDRLISLILLQNPSHWAQLSPSRPGPPLNKSSTPKGLSMLT